MWLASHRWLMRPWPEGASATSWPAQGRRSAIGHCRQHPRPPVHRRGAQTRGGRGLHPASGPPRAGCVAVADLFSRRGRLVDERHHDRPARDRCADDGDLATRESSDALLHHSIRGSQYTSEQFQRLMADNGVTCSMSRSGNVWDNAAMELLLIDEDRTDRPEDISKRAITRRPTCSTISSVSTTRHAGTRPLSQPHGLRAASAGSLTRSM